MTNNTQQTTHVRMRTRTRDKLNRVCAVLMLRGVQLNQIDAIDKAVDALVDVLGVAGELGEGGAGDAAARKGKPKTHRL